MVKMKLKNYWDNKDLFEKYMLIFIILIIVFLIVIKSVSGLTEEERIKNNQLLNQIKEKGEIPLEIGGYDTDLNPFFILGFLTIGIIILVYILIRVINRDRL